jgi:hypothetical protein
MKILAHAHSDWSHDGRIALSDWPDVARRAGADEVWLTEHEESGWTRERYADYVRACAAASTADVRLVPGIEFLQDGQHVLCYGLREWPDRPSTASALAAAVEAQHRFLCLAHPGKYRWRPAPGLREAVHAVEVWNSKWIYDGTVGPHPASLALAQGRLPLAGQDVHQAKHLSGLLIEPATGDAFASVRAGRYRIVCGRRAWNPDAVRRPGLAAAVQWLRTPLLRAALGTYRWLRRRGVIPRRSGNERVVTS